MCNFVILALGSNVGDRLANLRKATKSLPLSNIKYSNIYECEAVLPNNAPDSWNKPFLNIAISGYTNLNPYKLLGIIKNIEKKLGRTNKQVWSPRPIDIDIITWSKKLICSKTLKIPHPLLNQRAFVLLPINDIYPCFIHPIFKTSIKTMLVSCGTSYIAQKYSYSVLKIRKT